MNPMFGSKLFQVYKQDCKSPVSENKKPLRLKTSRGMRHLSVIHYQRYVCVNAVEQQAGVPAGKYTPINLQNFNIE